MYRVLRRFLFCLSADKAHYLTLWSLKYMPLWWWRWLGKKSRRDHKTVFGLSFSSSVGLAAGFDKNGEAIDALLALGFGFIEVGAVTPRPQPGNPKPHVRRFVGHDSVVNACGFNNKGVDYLVERLKARRLPGVVGVNLGKNKQTPNEQAASDYIICLRKVYPYADFITINISSPNTVGLRDLQQTEYLDNLLQQVMAERQLLAQQHNKTCPLLVKLSPDLTTEQIQQTAQCLLKNKVDGVIATNTTLQHDLLPGLAEQQLPGGLSGKALTALSRDVLQQLVQCLQGQLPIISVGGIDSHEEVQWRLTHGADLVQVYTGLIYKGTSLLR